MAYDRKLAERIRQHLGKRRDITEQHMFGGLAFMVNGNLCCGVRGDELLVRIPPAESDQALRRPHTRMFDVARRPMNGWILIRPAGLTTDASLAKWIQTGTAYAASLPAK